MLRKAVSVRVLGLLFRSFVLHLGRSRSCRSAFMKTATLAGIRISVRYAVGPIGHGRRAPASVGVELTSVRSWRAARGDGCRAGCAQGAWPNKKIKKALFVMYGHFTETLANAIDDPQDGGLRSRDPANGGVVKRLAR